MPASVKTRFSPEKNGDEECTNDHGQHSEERWQATDDVELGASNLKIGPFLSLLKRHSSSNRTNAAVHRFKFEQNQMKLRDKIHQTARGMSTSKSIAWLDYSTDDSRSHEYLIYTLFSCARCVKGVTVSRKNDFLFPIVRRLQLLVACQWIEKWICLPNWK